MQGRRGGLGYPDARDDHGYRPSSSYDDASDFVAAAAAATEVFSQRRDQRSSEPPRDDYVVPPVPAGLSERGKQNRAKAIEIARKFTRQIRLLSAGSEYAKRWIDVSGANGEKIAKKIYLPVDEEPDMNFLGLIIGPRGSTQKYLEQESGARILIRGRGSSKDGNDQDPHEPLYVQVSADNFDQLDRGCQLITELLFNKEERAMLKNKQLRTVAQLKNGPDNSLILNDALYATDVPIPGVNKGEFSEDVKVPRDRVGHIIGKGGDTIRMIQAKTGAFVQVAKDGNEFDDFKMIHCEGNQEQVEAAKAEINRLLTEFENKKREALGIPENHELLILNIPNDTVGLLIGKSGQTIKQLQMRTGANIQVTRDKDASSSSTTRAVTVSGPPNNVALARREIENLIRTQSEAHPDFAVGIDAKEIELRIPSGTVGTIIGKGGETIKNLQMQTGAKIVVARDDVGKERPITIQGPAASVDAAVAEINALVAQNATKNPTAQITVSAFTGEVDPATAYAQMYGYYDPASYAAQFQSSSVLAASQIPETAMPDEATIAAVTNAASTAAASAAAAAVQAAGMSLGEDGNQPDEAATNAYNVYYQHYYAQYYQQYLTQAQQENAGDASGAPANGSMDSS